MTRSTSRIPTPAKTSVPAAPEHYVWWFPGSPVQIHLALHVVQRLGEYVRSSETGVPQEGLLFGDVLDGAIEILDFQAASSGGVTELLGDLLSGPDKPSLLGCYRTEQGETLCLNDSDRSLDELFFGEPHHIFLVIQPTAFGPPNATFFFHDSGRSMTDFSFPGFPFDSSRLAIEELARIQRLQQAATEQPVAVPPPATNGHQKKHGVLKTAGWLIFAMLIVLASGMLINSPAFRERGSRMWSAISHPPPQAAPPSMWIALGLQAERQNGDLKLTWNRQSAAVLSATSGVLSIKDGSTDRTIDLDSAQIRNGSVLYAPATGEIQMQLTVSASQETTSESVLVILPETGSPRVQILSRKEIPTATIIDAEPPNVAQPHRPSKSFTLPVEPRQAEKSGGTSSLPVNEPPQLIVKTDPAALFPHALGQPVVPPLQPAPPQPLPTTQSIATLPQSPAARSSLPVYPPMIISSVPAVYPPELKSMGPRSRTVEIKVSIDEAGRVVKAEPMPQRWLPQSMVQAAVEATRRFKFKPARIGNQDVPGEMVLKFDFKRL